MDYADIAELEPRDKIHVKLASKRDSGRPQDAAAAAYQRTGILLDKGASVELGEIIGRGTVGVVYDAVLTERSGERAVTVGR